MLFKYFLTILLLGISLQGYSCKCGNTPEIEDSFKGSSVLVHGRVVSKKVVSLEETMDANKAADIKGKLRNDADKLKFILSNRIVEIQFVVEENFKGSSAGDTLTIYTPALSGSCRYWFDVDKEYIVYTLKKCWLYGFFLDELADDDLEKKGTYWTYSCTRTTEYTDAEAEALRKLKITVR